MGSIYKYTNTINKKSYIGQTTRNKKARKREHLSGKGSRLLKSAFEKYGEDAFTFEILHDNVMPLFLDTLEKEEIAKANSLAPHGYNLKTGGNTNIAFSDEARLKMSNSAKGRTAWNKGKRGLQTAWNKGKTGGKLSDEHKRKIGEASKGNTARKGKKLTDTHKHKISKALSGKKYNISPSSESSRLGMPKLAFHIRIHLYKRAGWSQKKIAETLKKCRATISKYTKLPTD